MLPEAVHIHQPQPYPAIRIDATDPVVLLHINRGDADPVALSVLDQGGGMV